MLRRRCSSTSGSQVRGFVEHRPHDSWRLDSTNPSVIWIFAVAEVAACIAGRSSSLRVEVRVSVKTKFESIDLLRCPIGGQPVDPAPVFIYLPCLFRVFGRNPGDQFISVFEHFSERLLFCCIGPRSLYPDGADSIQPESAASWRDAEVYSKAGLPARDSMRL